MSVRYTLFTPASNQYPLDFIERHLVAPAIVKLRGTRAGVIGHGRGLLERAAVLEIRCDTRGAKAVVADQSLDAGRRGPAANHCVRIGLGQGSTGELAGAAADSAEERGLRIAGQVRACDVGLEDLLERVMTRHRMVLAALFMQPHPQAAVLGVDILDLHGEGGADAGERINHQPDESAITQPRRRRRVDRIKQAPRLGRLEHRRLAAAHHMTRPTHRGRRIEGHDLAGDQPVEQMADRGQVLLHARRRHLAHPQLDPRRHMQRLNFREGIDARFLAPRQKICRGSRVRAPRVRIADLGCEELEKPRARALARMRDQRRQSYTGRGRNQSCRRCTFVVQDNHGFSMGLARATSSSIKDEEQFFPVKYCRMSSSASAQEILAFLAASR
jgi:hypothetical protein